MSDIEGKKPRYVGFDILRIILTLPTIMLHVWNNIYGDVHVTFKAEESLHSFYENYIPRLLGYSGIFIFCLSFFLHGLNNYSLFKGNSVNKYIKYILLISAMVATQFNDHFNVGEVDFFVWDIFSFVLVSYLLVSLLDLIKSPKVLKAIFGLSVVLFIIPYQGYSNLFSNILVVQIEQIFFATNEVFGYNGWFVFPWIGITLMFYSLGRLKVSFSKNSYWFFLVIGCLFLFFSTESNPPALGELFYKYIFWQNPIYILARLFIFTGILLFLYEFKFNRLWNVFSLLQWNKNFWFCYILHFGFIDIASDYKEHLSQNLFLLDWLWLGVFFGVEILAQLFLLMAKVYLWIIKLAFKIFKRQISRP